MRPGLPDPLLDLLGARWSMGAPVAAAAWFDADTAGFGLADGTLAIARSRWDGGPGVRQRPGGGIELVPATAPPRPVMRAGVHAGPCLAVVADGLGRLFSGGADGALAATGPDGSTGTLARHDAPVTHLAAVGALVACAVGARAHRLGDVACLDLPGPVGALAGHGGQLAIGHPQGVTLWSAQGAARLGEGTGGSLPQALAWSPDGTLAAAFAGQVKGWRLPDGPGFAFDVFDGPCPSLSFAPDGRLAAAGGSRVVCWRLDDPPVGSPCGVASTVAVALVACHPHRPLIAAGYGNGAVLLCQPDSADILFVRAAGGGAVTALAWSPDGACLAIGAAGGEIGLVTFPQALFRIETGSAA